MPPTQHYPVGTAGCECRWDRTDPTQQQHPLLAHKLRAATRFTTAAHPKAPSRSARPQSHQLSSYAGTSWSQRLSVLQKPG